MYAKLQGQVIDIFDNFIILDVNGVGYRVEGNLSALQGDDIEVYIHTHVRENEIRLFGFKDKDDFILFEVLLQVSGVGPKAAMTIIRDVGKNNIFLAVNTDDAKLLRAPGVGQKTAERLLIDLRSKLDKLNLSIDKESSEGLGKQNEYLSEVSEALLSLGYSVGEVDNALKEIDYDSLINIDSSSIIKKALIILSSYKKK